MADEKKDEKKIFIDEDWKQQAKKEKDVLAAEEKAQNDEEQGGGQRELPEGDFAALVSMLFTQTLFSLGFIQVKGQDKRPPDLALAKYNIDMLTTLEAKTKGNLSKEESSLLKQTLMSLRLSYVEAVESPAAEKPAPEPAKPAEAPPSGSEEEHRKKFSKKY